MTPGPDHHEVHAAGLHARAIDHIVLVTPDVETCAAWYRDELGMDVEGLDRFRAGQKPFASVRVSADTIIDLLPGERRGRNVDHFALVIDEDVDEVAASGRFDVVRGPADLSGARGTGRGLYVRDPAGNTVELRNYRSPPLPVTGDD
jgi:catechol 2,3-dioxygenase-like lactoylglutathione lyase family enzyme